MVAFISLSQETVDRLLDLAEAVGADVDTTVQRLLDRDRHDHAHPHRCPTCVRLEDLRQRGVDPDAETLFEPA